jgi:hypothetical protein
MKRWPPELEADLLDHVEGVALSPDAAARVEQALREDPGLAELVRGMQADRAGLRAMGMPTVPAGLIEGVEAALEREALLGLARSEAAVEAAIPVSRITPIRTPVFSRPMARALAVAAGLMVVSGVAWMAIPSGRPADSARTVALQNAEMVTATSGSAGSAPAVDQAAGQEARLALADTDASAMNAGAAFADGRAPAEQASAAVADAGAAADEPAWALAVGLADEGRLAVRVSGLSRERMAGLFRGERVRRGMAWLDVPAESSRRVLAALPARESAEAARRPLVAELPVASARADEQRSPGQGAPASRARAAPVVQMPPPIEPEVMVVSLARDGLASGPESGLEAMVRRLREAGATVRLEVLAHPAPVALPRDPMAIMWWTLPPEAWRERVGVPVLIDRR